MALELIKISEFPESSDLKEWFIVGDINGISYKISRANLESELGISSLLQMGGAIVPTSTPEPTGDYFWIATQEGAYTNFGGTVVPDGSLAVISRVSGVFTSSITTIPQPDNKIDEWVDGTNTLGTQRFHSGQIWEVVVPSTTQEPGTGTEWVGKINKVSQEDFQKVEPVEGLMFIKNYLDKSKFTSGSFVHSTGIKNPSNNWISSEIFDIPEDIVNFTLQDHGSISATVGLVIFFDENNVFVPGSIMAQGTAFTTTSFSRSEIPVNAKRWGFNLGNATDIGLTPTDNLIANRVMLRDSLTSSEYAGFGYLLDGSKLYGLPESVATKDELNALSAVVDQQGDTIDIILQDYDKYYAFNGTSSSFNLPETYLLVNDGDYLEIESRYKGGTMQEGLSLIGAQSNETNNVFGYYTDSSMWLRERKLTPSDPSPAYLQFNGLPSLYDFRVIRLSIIGGNYELSVDGVLIDSNPKTNGIEIRNIGQAYSIGAYFKGDLKRLHIHKEAFESNPVVDILIDDFTGTGSTDVDVIYEEGQADTAYPDFFYEVNPTGAAGGFPKITIYTKRKGASKTYVGHEIIRYVDTDPVVFVDYYRNAGAWNYQYDGSVMTRLSTKSLTANENEFTLLQAPYPIGTGYKIDHSGGVHGDEKTLSVSFLVDGVEINPNTLTELTPAKSINYTTKSTLHNAATGTKEAPVIDPSHTIVAEHTKNVDFGNGGYRITNLVKSKIDPSLPITKMYSALLCNHKDQATWGRNEMSEMTEFTFQSGEVVKLLNPYTREFYGSNPITELSSYITTRVVYPIELDSQRENYNTDRAQDTKNYSELPAIILNPGTPPLELAFDDVIIVEAVFECIGGE